MTITKDTTDTTTAGWKPEGHWIEAGEGWGARPVDWAYLFEPYARPANDLLFDRLGVGDGTSLLDVACGSGLAANTASRRGASVAGLDASAALIDIARARTPEGDFRVGDMFDLPFERHFDVVTSFNGIWNRCEAALREVRRVLVGDGRFGMTFWGEHDRLGLMPYFMKVLELSPPSHQTAMMDQDQTRQAIGDIMAAANFELDEQGTVEVVNEWPDVDTAVRALAAAGPSVPAIEAVGYDAFCHHLRDVVEPRCHPGTGVRISSELGWATARPTLCTSV
ncbi:MAG: class I SAM-dependent methyltransferase [Microthrixaceae bacterium]